jgi:hypothetical protein
MNVQVDRIAPMSMRHRSPASPSADLTQVFSRVAAGQALQTMLLMPEGTPTPITGPLLDAVALFEQLNIGYALVGGIAAMYYGRARFTDDVDFVADFLHDRVLAANPEAMTEHHFDPTCTYKLYHASGVDIDLWKDEFSYDIVDRAGEATLGGRTVRIADPNDLVAMKLRAGRPQDDYDVSEMIRAGVVDVAVVRTRVTEEQYARFGAIMARTPR